VAKFADMFSRFDTIPACDRQTDKRTSFDGIVRADAEHRAIKSRQQVHRASWSMVDTGRTEAD